jgi:predicted DNA binding CopG/RHH family protein
MRFASFDWDSGNWPKCGKHGVSREEIEEVLLGAPAVLVDPHPHETRMRAIGKTTAGRYVGKSTARPKFGPSAPATCIRRKLIIMKAKLKPMPPLRSEDAAEAFVASANLSEYDLSGFSPMRFEIEPKSAALNMRLPASLLAALKAKAKASGVPYTRYVRMLLETDVAQRR